MMMNPETYVPSIRWRQGEYQALFRLSEQAKKRIVPLILIPEVEFDFEEWKPKKSVHEHVQPFPKRYKSKWGTRPSCIDIDPKIQEIGMADGRLPVSFVFDELREYECTAVPVLSLDHPPSIVAAVGQIVRQDGQGLGVRVRVEHIMKPSCYADVLSLVSKTGVPLEEVDLIIDLESPIGDQETPRL